MSEEKWSCYECGWVGEPYEYAPSGKCWDCEEQHQDEMRADYGAEEEAT